MCHLVKQDAKRPRRTIFYKTVHQHYTYRGNRDEGVFESVHASAYTGRAPLWRAGKTVKAIGLRDGFKDESGHSTAGIYMWATLEAAQSDAAARLRIVIKVRVEAKDWLTTAKDERTHTYRKATMVGVVN